MSYDYDDGPIQPIPVRYAFEPVKPTVLGMGLRCIAFDDLPVPLTSHIDDGDAHAVVASDWMVAQQAHVRRCWRGKPRRRALRLLREILR